MYADSPERDRSPGEAPSIPIDHDMADRFNRLVRSLPEEERVAWMEHVLGTSKQRSSEVVERARVRLIMWWSGVPV